MILVRSKATFSTIVGSNVSSSYSHELGCSDTGIIVLSYLDQVREACSIAEHALATRKRSHNCAVNVPVDTCECAAVGCIRP